MTNLTNIARYLDLRPQDHRPEPTTLRDARTHQFPRIGKTMRDAGPRDQPTPKDGTPNRLLSLFETYAFEQHYQPDRTILLHGDTTDAIYRVVFRTIRCCTISEDSRRQIIRFARKGEFVGISDMDTWH